MNRIKLPPKRLPKPDLWTEWQQVCYYFNQSKHSNKDTDKLRNFAKMVKIPNAETLNPHQLCAELAKNLTDFKQLSKTKSNVKSFNLNPNLNLSIIERELLRERLYAKITNWAVYHLKPKLKLKEVQHLLLRYIFNKVITRTATDDPVFITTPSKIAEIQIQKDFKYFKINHNPQTFIVELEKQLQEASDLMTTTPVKADLKPYLDFKGYIHYGQQQFYDINYLAKNNKDKINYLVALNIRYNMLELSTHGLANLYNEKWTKRDGTEAFASVFNHYFDIFCTAFPDLEAPFGSIGSFFEITEWQTERIFVNPPFDETLMTEVVHKVILDLDQATRKHEFILTLPNWKDMDILKELKTNPFTIKYKEYKKGELPFKDYMKNKIIYPVDIVEICLSNAFDIDQRQKIHQMHGSK